MRAPAPARGLSAGYGSMTLPSPPSSAFSTPVPTPRDAAAEEGPLPTSTSPSPREVTVDEEIDAIGIGRFHAAAVCVLGLANASDAVELLCVSFILPRLPADAFNDNDRAVLSSAIFVGMLVGGLVFGSASDRVGRRGSLVAALLINAVFGALSSVCPERPYGLLVATRVMGGFGVGGSIPGVFSLVTELLPTRDRGFYITLVAWFWMVGSLYAAGAAWLMIGTLGLSWRLFALACALPALAAAGLVALVLPESPRYLVLAGRPAAAEAALLYIARWNGADSRLTRGYRLAAAPASAAAAAVSGAAPPPASSAEQAAGDWGRTGGARGKGASAAAAPPPLPAANAFSIGSEDGDDDGAHAGARGGAGAVASAGSRGGATSLELVAGSASQSAPAVRSATAPAAPVAGDDEGFDERVGLTASPASAGGALKSWLAPLWSLLSGPAGSEAPDAGAGRGAPSPLQQFFSPQLRQTALPLMAVWFCLSLGWYGLTLWIPTIFAESDVELDEFQDAFLVQAANLPGNIVSSLLVDRIGRKAVLSWSLVLACCAAAAFPFAHSEWSVLLCACLLNAASTCTWNALDVLSTEAFPTSLRATAMGVLAATGRVGSMSGQFVFGSLIHVSLFALLGVAAGVLLLGAAAGAALPRDGLGRRLGEHLGDDGDEGEKAPA